MHGDGLFLKRRARWQGEDKIQVVEALFFWRARMTMGVTITTPNRCVLESRPGRFRRQVNADRYLNAVGKRRDALTIRDIFRTPLKRR